MELFVGSLSRGQVGAIAAAVARSSYCGISRALNAARLAGSPAEHGSCGHGRHMVTSARKLLPAAGLARPAVVPSPREAWILLGGGVMSRSMGSAPGGGGDVKVYQSSAETAMKSLAIASLAQFGICVMMGCLIVWHPAAATRYLSPHASRPGSHVDADESSDVFFCRVHNLKSEPSALLLVKSVPLSCQTRQRLASRLDDGRAHGPWGDRLGIWRHLCIWHPRLHVEADHEDCHDPG